MANFEVGQRVFYAPHGRRERAQAATVKRVGRKWVEVAELHLRRFNVETGAADGGIYSSPGVYWPSEDAYHNHVAIKDAWAGFMFTLRDGMPAGATVERIDAACDALGVKRKQHDGF